MRTFHFFIIFVFALSQLAYSQTPGSNSRKALHALDSSKKSNEIDSISFIPKPIGWTNDFINLFSKKEVEIIDALISNYERKTSVEFSVATIDSSMMGPIEFEHYTLLMLRTWGVGKKEMNNGILIVIAPHLRRVRIQNGYGIEKVLENKETKEIIDSVFMPNFKKGKFFTGTKKGIIAIIRKLEQKGL